MRRQLRRITYWVPSPTCICWGTWSIKLLAWNCRQGDRHYVSCYRVVDDETVDGSRRCANSCARCVVIEGPKYKHILQQQRKKGRPGHMARVTEEFAKEKWKGEWSMRKMVGPTKWFTRWKRRENRVNVYLSVFSLSHEWHSFHLPSIETNDPDTWMNLI